MSGAGLDFWAQRSNDLHIITDDSLPGAVLVNSEGTRLQTLIQIFELKNNSINDVLPLLASQPGWDTSLPCKFEKIESGKNDVTRYILIPDGMYADSIQSIMLNEPVPSTCSGWGVGNSGMRYFEIHTSHPDQALFIKIGQELTLFDEKTIHSTPDSKNHSAVHITCIAR